MSARPPFEPTAVPPAAGSAAAPA
ncbi:MAG: hypothetical protein JWM60_2027, partial [Solirubrobacterales bacterium]|nr:hypothetical protein [Solirubrobacterales bacterium]